MLMVLVHRHDRHLHPCLSGVQENRERWRACFRRICELLFEGVKAR